MSNKVWIYKEMLRELRTAFSVSDQPVKCCVVEILMSG